MKNYIFRENQEFDKKRFNEEIKKALMIITENEGLKQDSFNEIRHSFNINYSINGIEYEGELINIEIRKDNVIIGQLDCFKDVENKFIEICSIPNN